LLAIIPARGGSKGLPGKNVKLFRGKPLIAYTIEEAQKSKYIDKIIVTTDSKEIAEVALKYGANVPFLRPKELAGDRSPVIDTYFYTIDRLIEEGLKIEDFIVLQPTSPLRKSTHIDQAIKIFEEKNADSVISVSENEHPIEWTKIINEEDKLISFFRNNNLNRQEYKKTYRPNGMIFIFNYSALKKYKNYYMINTYPMIIENKYDVDIDTILDFEYAEFLYDKFYL